MKKLMMAALVASCLGCLHTREVDTRTSEEPASEEPAKKEAKQDAPRKEAPQTAKKPQEPTSSPEARPPVEEGRPELSVSPEGLMAPDGPRLIQQALAKRGYLPGDHQTGKLDKETSGALRKFQIDEKLARTGAPDRETVRRLGLSVEKVFRSSKRD